MKKIYPLVAATIFAGGMATAALAAGPETGAAAGSTTHGSSATSGATAKEGSGAMSSAMHKDLQGEHTMSATISEIDREDGSLTLKTDKDTLELHFPPSTLANFREGEQVMVHLGIAKQEGTQPSTSSGARTGSSAAETR